MQIPTALKTEYLAKRSTQARKWSVHQTGLTSAADAADDRNDHSTRSGTRCRSSRSVNKPDTRHVSGPSLLLIWFRSHTHNATRQRQINERNALRTGRVVVHDKHTIASLCNVQVANLSGGVRYGHGKGLSVWASAPRRGWHQVPQSSCACLPLHSLLYGPCCGGILNAPSLCQVQVFSST